MDSQVEKKQLEARSLLSQEEMRLGENQVMNFSAAFLDKQRRADTTPVEQMSVSQRMFSGLPEEAELEEAAPVIADKSRMGHFEKKAAAKSEKAQLTKYNAALEKRERQRAEEQKKSDDFRKTNLELDELMNSEGFLAYMKENGLQNSLDPNQYVGGEDDVINSGILVEMMKNPAGFGLFEKDSDEAAGYTVANLQELYRTYEQQRYNKWRYRLLPRLSGYFTERSYDTALSEEEQKAASAKADKLSAHEAVYMNNVVVADLTLQRALAAIVNHKNFRIPEGGTTASVKKRDFNIPEYPGVSEFYKQAQRDNANLVLFNSLYMKSTSQFAALKKDSLAMARSLADELLTEEQSARLFRQVDSSLPFFTPLAVQLYSEALDGNPPPEDEAQLREYNSALGSLVNGLFGVSSVSLALEQKKLLLRLYPDVFEDKEGMSYKKAMSGIASEQANMEETFASAKASVEKLRGFANNTDER